MADGLQFLPAVVDAGSSAVPRRRTPHGKVDTRSRAIEVEINGVMIRFGRGAKSEPSMVAWAYRQLDLTAVD